MASPLYGPLSRMLPGAQSPDDALKTFLGMSPTTPDVGVQQAPADDPRVGPTIAVPDSASEPLKYSTNPEKDAAAYDAHNRADYEQKQALVDFFNPQNQQKVQQEFGQKYDLAMAPARIAGQSAQDVQRLKNQGDVDLQNAQSQQGKDAIAAFQSLSGGNSGGGMAPVTLKPSINPKGQVSFTSQAVPAQTLQQQHAAQMGLEHYGDFRQAVDDLTKAGLVGPVAGRAADYLTTSGLDKALMSPDQARAFANFKAQTSLIKSNMAMVHGGARGGGSPEIAKRFDTLMSTHQSPEGLKGALDAFETWLKTYANAKDSSEMDAADAGLGLTPARAAQPAYLSGPGTEPPQ